MDGVRWLLRISLRRYWVFLAAIALSIGVTRFHQTDQPTRFRTNAVVEVSLIHPWLQESDATGHLSDLQHEIFNQMAFLRMRQLGERTVEALDPADQAEFAGNEADAARILGSRLEVKQGFHTNLLYVSLIGTEPERIARILNVMLRTLTAYNETRLDGGIAHLVKERRARLEVVEEELGTARCELEDFLAAHPDVAFDDPDFSVHRNAKAVRGEIEAARVESTLLVPLLQRLSLARTEEELRRVPIVAQDASLLELEQEEANLRARIEEFASRGLGERHGIVMETVARVNRNREEQSRTIERLVETQIQKRDWLEARVRSLEPLAAEFDSRWTELSRVIERHERLVQTARDREAVAVRQRELVARLDDPRKLPHQPIRVVSEADVPVRALERSERNYAFGVVVGFLAALGLVVFLEQLDDTIRTPGCVEARLGCAFLGSVPFLEGADDRERSTMVHQDAKSFASEAFRAIRTSIHRKFGELAEVAPRSSWILLLTSAGAAEGKTTAIVNLAMTHAHTGSRVLLVDADLRRPTLHERIGLYNEVGLTSYLIGCAGVEEVRQPTSIRNLTLVTSGPQAPNPYELLASPRMETFLAEARKSFDVVLIDTPPLLPVSDAVLLSSRVDASILVASATRTRYVEASRSRDLLLSRENAFLGVILNFTHRRPRTDYLEEYYPSYGYRYYRYEREPEEVG